MLPREPFALLRKSAKGSSNLYGHPSPQRDPRTNEGRKINVSDAERERWDARYREGAGATEPSAFIMSLDDVLPKSGRALDLAGGRGRHAIWLARRGMDVTVA